MRRGAVILAGGRSARMGRPKAFLAIAGEPVLYRIATLVQLVCPDTIVVGSPDTPLPELPPGVLRIDDPLERAHEGPLSGIAVGLDALARAGVQLAYLGSCDSVFLTAGHVQYLLDELEADRRHHAIVPESGPFEDGSRVLHPLAGAVRVAMANMTAEALVGSGQRSARSLYEGLPTRRVAVAMLPDPRVVRGCNTPDEWAAAVAELGSA